MSDPSAMPGRPELAVSIPHTLHDLDRQERDALEKLLRNQVLDRVGDIELLNTLMRLHDELARIPGWTAWNLSMTSDNEPSFNLQWVNEEGEAECWSLTPPVPSSVPSRQRHVAEPASFDLILASSRRPAFLSRSQQAKPTSLGEQLPWTPRA